MGAATTSIHGNFGKPESLKSKSEESLYMENSSRNRIQQLSSDDSNSPRFDENNESHRWVELMQGLQQLSVLHHQAVTASVLERQKRREVAYKRSDVWVSDAKFMKEIQRLRGEGKLDHFEELLGLGEKCQNARDTLGPLEEELAVLDQRWESYMFQLTKAEREVYLEFKSEFDKAQNYPSGSESESAIQSKFFFEDESHDSQDEKSYSESGDDIDHEAFSQRPITSRTHSSSFPSMAHSPRLTLNKLEHNPTSDSMLLGLDETSQIQKEPATTISSNHTKVRDLASKVAADIDLLECNQNPLFDQSSDIEIFENHTPPHPRLDKIKCKNRATDGDRIDEWLLQILLLSRVEATFLKEQLGAANPVTPSNWSQLVIAWWGRDKSVNVDVKIEAEHTNHHDCDDSLFQAERS